MSSNPKWNESLPDIENRRLTGVDSGEAWDRDDSLVMEAEHRGGLLNRVKAKVLRAYNYIIRLRGSPEEIAWGLALGLFIAMSPTVGLQMAIAVPVATALRGNPAAAAAGCWLTNPLTIPFLYGLNYWIGATLLGYDATVRIEGDLTLELLLSSGGHVWWSLIVGGLITGLISAVVAYYPTIYMVRAGRATLARRREKRRARRAKRALARAKKSHGAGLEASALRSREL